MAISKRVAGFNDTQADSITRKTIAKKKPEMMRMLQRCFTYGKKNCEGPAGWEDNDNLPWYDPIGKYSGEIEGGVNRGYAVEEVKQFFHSIEKYSSYCFNRSHAACYALIGILSAWLKCYYPVEFWAAVMTVTDDTKINKYINIVKNEGIKMEKPDINVSGASFTSFKKKILFGLGKIKGIGEASVTGILEERKKGPFKDLADINERLPKKILRQNVMFALIKAGAFDFENENRLELLNECLDIRKDKKTVRFDGTNWSEELCQNMEEEALGIAITYEKWWDTIKNGEKIKDETVTVLKLREHTDKNGKLMAFFDVTVKNCKISAVMFASHYVNNGGIDLKEGKRFVISGRKKDNKLFVEKVQPFSLKFA